MDGGLSCLIIATSILIIGVCCEPILVSVAPMQPGVDCRRHITATRTGGRFRQLRADSTTLSVFLFNEPTRVVRAQSEQNRRRSAHVLDHCREWPGVRGQLTPGNRFRFRQSGR